MDISRLINTDVGNLNESSSILWDDYLSMYNTIHIFLKFTCSVGKKIWKIFPEKNKSIF